MISNGSARRGAALALAVVSLVVLTLLAHGALLLARQEHAASVASGRLLTARVAAESAVHRAMEASVSGLDTVPRLGVAQLTTGGKGPVAYEGRARRLGRELWLLEGVASVGAGGWRRSVGRLVWMLDPVNRVAEHRAVVEVGEAASVGAAGTLEGGRPSEDGRVLPDPACEAVAPTLDSIFPTPLPVAGTVGGGVRWPSLGRLSADELRTRIPVTIAGSGTPAPESEGGRCLLGVPWSWGDPDRPGGPCSGHFPARFGPGSVRVEGGVGQGLLVVMGDLALDGTLFDGLVLVGGMLSLTRGAQVRGLVRAGAGVTIDASSGVVASGCAPLLSLRENADALSAPVPTPGGWLALY